ncbi:MAG: hypothetical protein AB9869_33415 [Verrucomicrobiia bacterium]
MKVIPVAIVAGLALLISADLGWAAGVGPGQGGGSSAGGGSKDDGGAGGGESSTNPNSGPNNPAPGGGSDQNPTTPPGSGTKDTPPGPRPERPLTPADVQALVKRFEQDRQAFMAKQQAIEQQMLSLPEQERHRLRAQLKNEMEKWKQQQAGLREQLRMQCDRMAEQLRNHSRLIDRVGNEGSSPGGRPRGRSP